MKKLLLIAISQVAFIACGFSQSAVSIIYNDGTPRAVNSTYPLPITGTVTATVTPATSTTVVSTALEASHVGKSSAGSLVSLHVLNTNTSAQYILVMNSATVPANGAVTLLYPPIYVPGTSNVSLTFPSPLVASTGIAVCNSSTGTFTKTIGSADCIFTIQVQ